MAAVLIMMFKMEKDMVEGVHIVVVMMPMVNKVSF